MWWLFAPLFFALPCPRVADVEGELVRQRGERARPPHETLSIQSDDYQISVQFGTASSPVSRVIPQSENCEETTRLVAAIVAAWESGDTPRTELALPVPPLVVTSIVSTTRRTEPPRRPTGFFARRVIDWDVAAAFVAGWQDGAFSPGGTVDLRLTRRGVGFAGSLGVLFDGGRTQGNSDDRGEWTRPTVRLGAEYRIVARRLSIDLRANVGLGVFVATRYAIGLTRNNTEFDPSLGAGVRFGGAIGHVRPFVGFEFVGWLRRQTQVDFGTIPTTHVIPRWDLLAVAGVAFTTGEK